MTQSKALSVPAFTQSMMPSLPAELRDALAQQFGAAMDSFGGNYNRLSLKGSRFGFIVGGTRMRETIDPIDVIILGMSPEQYCAWYEGKYTGEDGVAPTAVWAQNEQLPPHVPATVLEKDAEGRNKYALRRRVVIVAFEHTPDGKYTPNWDQPYVFDVGGSSCFGEKLPLPNGQGEALSLSAYVTALKTSGVYPICIPTRVVLDGRSGVPEVRFLPHKTETGAPRILPTEMILKGMELASSTNVKEMLDWRRTAETAAPAAPAAQPAVNAHATATATQPLAAQAAQATQGAAGAGFAAEFSGAMAFDAPQTAAQPAVQPAATQNMAPIQPAGNTMEASQAGGVAGQPTINTAPLADAMTAAIQPAANAGNTEASVAPAPAGAEADLNNALGDLAASLNF